MIERVTVSDILDFCLISIIVLSHQMKMRKQNAIRVKTNSRGYALDTHAKKKQVNSKGGYYKLDNTDDERISFKQQRMKIVSNIPAKT